MPKNPDIWLSETRFTRVQNVIFDWLPMVKIVFQVPEGGEEERVLCKLFMETLLAGCSFNNESPGSLTSNSYQRLEQEDTEVLLAVLQGFTEPSGLNKNEQRSEVLERVDNFKIGMLEIVGGAKLFITESKYIGIASSSMKIGDEVWVLKGGNVPFLLLRRLSFGSHEYMLVGDCFVNGCMDGELIDELEKNPTKIRIF
jgi:hypothetical protein